MRRLLLTLCLSVSFAMSVDLKNYPYLLAAASYPSIDIINVLDTCVYKSTDKLISSFLRTGDENDLTRLYGHRAIFNICVEYGLYGEYERIAILTNNFNYGQFLQEFGNDLLGYVSAKLNEYAGTNTDVNTYLR